MQICPSVSIPLSSISTQTLFDKTVSIRMQTIPDDDTIILSMNRVDVLVESPAAPIRLKLNRGGNISFFRVTIAFAIAKNRTKIRIVRSVFIRWCRTSEEISKWQRAPSCK